MKKNSFGTKADNLERLLVAGFNLPKFYVVPASAMHEIDDASNLKKHILTFEHWIHENSISSVAVRSSSTLEDSEKNSFAGQFKSILNVDNSKDFIDALNEVLQSRHSQSYSTNSGTVNAIIQEFIEPDISGVIFSINPANGNNEFVINAAHGRGTTVVEGSDAEQYFVNRLSFSYTAKHVAASSKQNALPKPYIEALSSLALQIESLFGAPQDIEWAIKDGIIYVLQARPITRINHLRLWDSSNIAESFPGIVLPLTFSIAKRGYMLGYKAQAYSAGLTWYELEKNHRTFDAMIGIFNGRMYYNLLNWYKFIALFPGSKRNQKFLDAQIATQGEALYQTPTKLSVGFKLRFAGRIFYRTLFFSRELKDFYKQFKTFESELARFPKVGDSQLLMQKYTYIETIIPHFGRSVDNDFFVMTYHGWLKKLLSRWLPESEFERSTIIGSIKGVLSAEQALSLYKIAEKFKQDKTALSLLNKNNYKALDEYLRTSDIQKEIIYYIENFGHRFAEDQKIESVNPMLEPFGIYKIIKTYIKLDSDEVNARLAKSVDVSKRMEKLISDKLSFYQRILYTVLLKRLKHHLRIREKNRLLRGRVYGHLRELFPKLGKAFENEGIIKHADDIFYLQIEEIYQLLQGSLITNDLSGRIIKRRNAYKEFSDIQMPERFMTTSMPSLEKIENLFNSKDQNIGIQLSGLISSPGTIEGVVVVLEEPAIPSEPFDILVTRHTDPGWTPLIALAKAVVVEHGGMLSHAAIITRELGIPSIIGVENVTSILRTGMRVRINTQKSIVEIIEK
jgi:phosphohistidine swiveling domain-containing protein